MCKKGLKCGCYKIGITWVIRFIGHRFWCLSVCRPKSGSLFLINDLYEHKNDGYSWKVGTNRSVIETHHSSNVGCVKMCSYYSHSIILDQFQKRRYFISKVHLHFMAFWHLWNSCSILSCLSYFLSLIGYIFISRCKKCIYKYMHVWYNKIIFVLVSILTRYAGSDLDRIRLGFGYPAADILCMMTWHCRSVVWVIGILVV